jgi:hypothetical protein
MTRDGRQILAARNATSDTGISRFTVPRCPVGSYLFAGDFVPLCGDSSGREVVFEHDAFP